MFDDRKKNPDNNQFGVIYFLCLFPYNSNFRCFKIKPLVYRTSNQRDSTVLLLEGYFNLTALRMAKFDGVSDR